MDIIKNQNHALRSLKREAGFTLVEIIVAVVIIGILLSVVTANYPAIRSRENLKQSQQLLQLKLAEAREKALKEDRDHVCIPDNSKCLEAVSREDQKKCSDIGVAVQGNSLVVFANTSGVAPRFDTSDCVISRQQLPGPVEAQNSEWYTILATALPPSIMIQKPDQSLILQAGEGSVALSISDTGQVTQEKNAQ